MSDSHFKALIGPKHVSLETAPLFIISHWRHQSVPQQRRLFDAPPLAPLKHKQDLCAVQLLLLLLQLSCFPADVPVDFSSKRILAAHNEILYVTTFRHSSTFRRDVWYQYKQFHYFTINNIIYLYLCTVTSVSAHMSKDLFVWLRFLFIDIFHCVTFWISVLFTKFQTRVLNYTSPILPWTILENWILRPLWTDRNKSSRYQFTNSASGQSDIERTGTLKRKPCS